MLRGWIVGLALGALAAGAAHAASFDARRPTDVAHALVAHGVSGRMTREDGETLFAGTAGTADQMNLWNNWAVYCPGFVDGDHLPQVWSFLAVSARTQPADLMANMAKWKGCLTDFGKFVAGAKA